MSTTELAQPTVHYDFRLLGTAPDTEVMRKEPNWGNHTMMLRPTLLRVIVEGDTISVLIRGHYVNSDGRASRLFYEVTYEAEPTARANSIDTLPEWATPYLADIVGREKQR